MAVAFHEVSSVVYFDAEAQLTNGYVEKSHKELETEADIDDALAFSSEAKIGRSTDRTTDTKENEESNKSRKDAPLVEFYGSDVRDKMVPMEMARKLAVLENSLDSAARAEATRNRKGGIETVKAGQELQLDNNFETGVYDEIDIEDMDYDAHGKIYTFPCPCGDKFVIKKDQLRIGEDIARCPSCSLIIRVVFDAEMFDDDQSCDDDDYESE